MIVNDVEEKEEAQKLFEDINTKLVLSWGVHPVILPLQFGIITALEISKEYGAMKIFEVSGISGENTLAIGDSTSDWQFMELCRFCGSMENGSDDLKKLLGKKHQNGIVGGSVDEDGLLEIFKYFGI